MKTDRKRVDVYDWHTWHELCGWKNGLWFEFLADPSWLNKRIKLYPRYLELNLIWLNFNATRCASYNFSPGKFNMFTPVGNQGFTNPENLSFKKMDADRKWTCHVLNLDETNTWNKSYKRNLWWNNTQRRKTYNFAEQKRRDQGKVWYVHCKSFPPLVGSTEAISQKRESTRREIWLKEETYIYIDSKENAPKIYRELEDELFLFFFFWEPQVSGRSISGRNRATTLP